MPAGKRKRKRPEGEERNRLPVYLRQIPRCCSDTRSSVSNENSSKSQTTTSRSGSSSSSYKSSPYDSYDKGYDDIYMIMTGTDITVTLIMRMVWMMPWMNLMRSGKA